MLWWQKPEWLAVYATVLGVIVAVVTLWCVVRQLRLEGRQTRLAERQTELLENQYTILETERIRRPAIVMFRKGNEPTDFRFYLKNVGDKVAREFIASLWLPEPINPRLGMWDPGGNLRLPGGVAWDEIQGLSCHRYERTFDTILIGDSEVGAFYFSIEQGQTLPSGTRVFWSVITVEGEKSPGDQLGVIELA